MASGETSSATFAHIESAQCLEEAAKMWRMDGHNVDRANGALKEAADRYRCYDRGVGRAARTYLMLGEKLMVGLAGDKDARNSVQQRRDALEALRWVDGACICTLHSLIHNLLYRTAAELFEVEHDSRSISAWVKVAELESTLAALARHSSSSSSSSSSSTATTFDTAIYTWMRCVHATSNDSAFAFQAGTYLANVGWCTLAIGDDVRMDRWIESTISEHLAFAETREFRLLQVTGCIVWYSRFALMLCV